MQGRRLFGGSMFPPAHCFVYEEVLILSIYAIVGSFMFVLLSSSLKAKPPLAPWDAHLGYLDIWLIRSINNFSSLTHT
jgi:hypothetical protein